MAKSASVPPDTSRHGTPRYVAQRYRLDTPIGRGGAGVVWRGEDELLQRPVAIKEILVPMAGAQNERDAIRARVLREARALARLHSPAIVSVYDVVEEHQRHWIIMELVDADSLGDVIRNQGPLPFDQVAAIGLALTDALAAAHSAGVLHRDVKPGNVLLGRDGRVRLTDFGIAATEGDVTLTGAGALVGSPAYIAPERVRGSSGTPASDLWGLGATLYSAVEGQPPFEGPETYAVLTAVVEGRRRAFRLAGPLRNLLSDLMDRPAEERPDVTEIRRRLIPIARNANPVPASVMHARPRTGEETDASSVDVGLENLDDPAEPAAGAGPAADSRPGSGGGVAGTAGVQAGEAAPAAVGDQGAVPRPTNRSASAAAPPVPADRDVTVDPLLNPLDGTAVAAAGAAESRTGRGEPGRTGPSNHVIPPDRTTPQNRAAPPGRTRPEPDHDAPTSIGLNSVAGSPVDDDVTRIGAATPVSATSDLDLFDDDNHAAGLLPLGEARRRAEPPRRDGHGHGPGDPQRRRQRTIAVVAGAAMLVMGAAIALTVGLTSGGSTPEPNDVTAQQTTPPPIATIASSPPAVTSRSTTSEVVAPDSPRYTYRPRPSSSATPTTTPTT
ncbi:serine/threonine-protein kinase, partial [Frankia sp. CcWB3]